MDFEHSLWRFFLSWVGGAGGGGFGDYSYGGERSDFEDTVAKELNPFCEGGGAGVEGERER